MLEEEPLYVNAKQYHRFKSNRIWCSLKMIEEGFTFQSNIIWVYNFCDQDIEATTGASKARS